MSVLSEFLIATIAAVAAGLVLSGLAWIAVRTPSLVTALENKPWAIAGLIGFASSSIALGVALGLSTYFYPSPRVKISLVSTKNVPVDNTFIDTLSDDEICVLSDIEKHGGDGAGHAYIRIENNNHWAAYSEGSPGSTLGAAVSCFKIALSR